MIWIFIDKYKLCRHCGYTVSNSLKYAIKAVRKYNGKCY